MRTSQRRRGYDRAADTVTPTPWPIAILAGAGGGVLTVGAFPPYDQWMLLPCGLGLLTIAILTRRWTVAALASFAWGLGFFIPLTQWANTYAGIEPWLALAVFEALYIVVFGVVARSVLVRRGPGLRSSLTVACLWVGCELLRGTFPWGGLTWGASAFALAESPLLNLGPWIGVAGLALIASLLGQLLSGGALLLVGRCRARLGPIGGVWPIAAVCATVLVATVVPLPVNEMPGGRSSVTVSGIQGSMGPIDPVSLAMPDDAFPNAVRTTDRAIQDAHERGQRLDLVVWPEDSVGIDPRVNPYYSSQLSRLARDADAPLLVGTQTIVGEKNRYNNAILWTADGDAPYVYAKRHPVPFGEYIPFRDFFRRLSPLVDMIGRDMLPGDKVGVFDIPSADGGPTARAGVLICFEIAYDGLVQDTVRDGAQMLIIQSNNALFGHSHEAIQQLAEAKVQAVVSGRSVVHVSTVGQSAIFAPDGRRLAYVDHWRQGAVTAQVPLRSGITPAVAAGPWIGIGATVLGLIGWFAALIGTERAVEPAVTRRRERGASK